MKRSYLYIIDNEWYSNNQNKIYKFGATKNIYRRLYDSTYTTAFLYKCKYVTVFELNIENPFEAEHKILKILRQKYTPKIDEDKLSGKELFEINLPELIDIISDVLDNIPDLQYEECDELYCKENFTKDKFDIVSDNIDLLKELQLRETTFSKIRYINILKKINENLFKNIKYFKKICLEFGKFDIDYSPGCEKCNLCNRKLLVKKFKILLFDQSYYFGSTCIKKFNMTWNCISDNFKNYCDDIKKYIPDEINLEKSCKNLINEKTNITFILDEFDEENDIIIEHNKNKMKMQKFLNFYLYSKLKKSIIIDEKNLMKYILFFHNNFYSNISIELFKEICKNNLLNDIRYLEKYNIYYIDQNFKQLLSIKKFMENYPKKLIPNLDLVEEKLKIFRYSEYNMTRKYEYEYDSNYEKIIKCISENSVSCVCGNAGSGKTEFFVIFYKIINNIRNDTSFIFLTPTGTASNNLRTKIQNNTNNCFTLELFNIQFNKLNLKKNIVLMIDESSMLDLTRFHNFLDNLKNYTNEYNFQFIFIGDDKQLQPVGLSNLFNYFIDKYPERSLRESKRNTNKIFDNCINNINDLNNQMYLKNIFNLEQVNVHDIYLQNNDDVINKISKIVFEYEKNEYQETGDNISICLTNENKYRKNINNIVVNKLIECGILDDEIDFGNNKSGLKYYVNMKTILLKNKFVKGQLYLPNGHLFRLADIKWNIYKDKFYVTGYDKTHQIGNPLEFSIRSLNEIDYAYCITIHKSQGMGFENIVVYFSKKTFYSEYLKSEVRPKLSKNFIYTALTRKETEGNCDLFIDKNIQLVDTKINRTEKNIFNNTFQLKKLNIDNIIKNIEKVFCKSKKNWTLKRYLIYFQDNSVYDTVIKYIRGIMLDNNEDHLFKEFQTYYKKYKNYYK